MTSTPSTHLTFVEEHVLNNKSAGGQGHLAKKVWAVAVRTKCLTIGRFLLLGVSRDGYLPGS